MNNGNYTITYYSTTTGTQVSSFSALVSTGILTFPLPDIGWDIAFTVIENSVLPLRLYSFTGNRRMNENYLNIDIANADNVKNIYLERSADGITFKSLSNVSAAWSSIIGKHKYVDKIPLRGNNFYRLKIVDKDGSAAYSMIINLVNNLVKFGVFPNPVNDDVILNIDEGKYFTEIIDQGGRLLISKSITVVGNIEVKIPVSKLAHGIYYLNVYDDNKNLIGYEKIVK